MSRLQPFEYDPQPLDAEIEAALRSAPLAPPPPLLYAAVMHRVRQSAPMPRFEVTWLDGALSLFLAVIPGLLWLGWISLPPLWLNILRLQSLYILQRLWYLEYSTILWAGTGLALIAVVFISGAAGWMLLHSRQLNAGGKLGRP